MDDKGHKIEGQFRFVNQKDFCLKFNIPKRKLLNFKNWWCWRAVQNIIEKCQTHIGSSQQDHIFFVVYVNENWTAFLYILNRGDKTTRQVKVCNKVEMLLTKKNYSQFQFLVSVDPADRSVPFLDNNSLELEMNVFMFKGMKNVHCQLQLVVYLGMVYNLKIRFYSRQKSNVFDIF